MASIYKMSLLMITILFYSVNALSFCRGKKVFYKKGKILELKSEQEFEKEAQFINRLDFFSVEIEGKEFTISKDGVLKFENNLIQLPKKEFQNTDFYFMTKANDKYYLRMGFDDGIDILVYYLVELDFKNKKALKPWQESCGHSRSYYTLLDGKMTYLCEDLCRDKLSALKNQKECKDFGKHLEIKFTPFKRVLTKDDRGVRYKTEWVKADKVECISATPISNEDAIKKMKEDTELIRKYKKD